MPRHDDVCESLVWRDRPLARQRANELRKHDTNKVCWGIVEYTMSISRHECISLFSLSRFNWEINKALRSSSFSEDDPPQSSLHAPLSPCRQSALPLRNPFAQLPEPRDSIVHHVDVLPLLRVDRCCAVEVLSVRFSNVPMNMVRHGRQHRLLRPSRVAHYARPTFLEGFRELLADDTSA